MPALIAMMTWPSVALAQDYTADVFAETIMSYIDETCTAPSRLDEVDSEIRRILAMPLGNESAAGAAAWVEALMKDSLAGRMTDIDKRSMALTFVFAAGVVHALEYMGMVADEDHLKTENYPEIERAQRGKTAYYLELMECIVPTKDEITSPAILSGFGTRGDELWQEIAKSVYTGSCRMEFLLFVRSYVDADFTIIPPEERENAVGDLMRAHGHYAEPESVAARCEEFT
jgi:hypothetical protein